MNDVKVEFGDLQAPLCESPIEICEVEDAHEGVVICAYCETVRFEVRADEVY